jgi:YHS domain-containing protein
MTEHKSYQCDVCKKRHIEEPKLHHDANTTYHFCSDECQREFKAKSEQLVFENPYACDATVRDGNGRTLGSLYADDAKHYHWIQRKPMWLDITQMKQILTEMEKLENENLSH